MSAHTDAFHAQQLASLQLNDRMHRKVMNFLRTQGFASVLGFRRTWPLPRGKPARLTFDTIADARDTEFARTLNDHNLLLPEMDALSDTPPQTADLWGGTTARKAGRTKAQWAVGTGTLWAESYRNVKCDDSDRIRLGYRAQAAARHEARVPIPAHPAAPASTPVEEGARGEGQDRPLGAPSARLLGQAPLPTGWLRDLWTAQGIIDDENNDEQLVTVGCVPCGEQRQVASARGTWPANVSFAQLIDAFVPEASQDRYVINIGANDGARHDPAFPLLVERGYGGVLLEGDPAFKKRLYANTVPFNSSGRVQISWGFASADSIGSRLSKLGAPMEADALKIDVDGLDVALLEAILRFGYRPKSIAVEINPDLPPPLQISQLDHSQFRFEFWRKHMRGWLGGSADALYALTSRYGYALLAIELGARETTACTYKGAIIKQCMKKATTPHAETNAWFVRADLLRAAYGIEPPTWYQFVDAFWKQMFAYNTFKFHVQGKVFAQQSFEHVGWFARADEDKPWFPECYMLSEHQFYKAQRGETFQKPRCPLQVLREEVLAHGGHDVARAALTGGWRAWAELSRWLAKPACAHAAKAFARSTVAAIKTPACQPKEACPFNVSVTTTTATEPASAQ